MRVVHLSTNDLAGGAAQAAFQLHLAMKRENVDSKMVVSEKQSSEASVIEVNRAAKTLRNLLYHFKRHKIKGDLKRYSSTRPSGYDGFSDDRSAYGRAILDAIVPSDVINLHWIAGFVDYGSVLKEMTEIAPVCWRLSDMNPFTGGCHYDHGCERFTIKCGMCPQLGSNETSDLSSQVWARKNKVFKGISEDRFHIIALNRWMADRVSNSSLLGKFPVSIIPNGVDVNLFSPCDRSEAREDLLIPVNSKVILFLADDMSNRRKGFTLLMEALDRISGLNDILLLSVGRNDPATECSLPHRHLGYFSDKKLLSKVYNAADIFVIPSLQDNQPNTVLESMACGTPVVSFNVGGIPEMVQDGVTGHLVGSGDVGAMSRVIDLLLQDDERRKNMQLACRETVVRKFTRKLQVQQYIKLYQDMVLLDN